MFENKNFKVVENNFPTRDLNHHQSHKTISYRASLANQINNTSAVTLSGLHPKNALNRYASKESKEQVLLQKLSDKISSIQQARQGSMDNIRPYRPLTKLEPPIGDFAPFKMPRNTSNTTLNTKDPFRSMNNNRALPLKLQLATQKHLQSPHTGTKNESTAGGSSHMVNALVTSVEKTDDSISLTSHVNGG